MRHLFPVGDQENCTVMNSESLVSDVQVKYFSDLSRLGGLRYDVGDVR